METVAVKITVAHDDLAPVYSSSGSAGADIKARVDTPVTILPGERVLIPTGVRMEIPPGFEIQVRPRSGLAIRHGITLLNSPGTIDSDYRGEVKIILINHGNDPFIVSRGDRVAQLVLSRAVRAEFIIQNDLQDTTRGSGGFGSTGI